jgi:hypothetical protein
MTIALFTQKSPVAKLLAVLRSFGSNAHLYLPGIGTISGITAGNYLDSVGTTAASVDGLIGLGIDAMGSLGAELFSAPTALGSGWSFSGGVLTASNVAQYAAAEANILATGKFYTISFRVVSISGGTLQALEGAINGINITIPGTYTFNGYASGNSLVWFRNTSASPYSFVIDSISVREVTGIHATQATTGNKPTLRQTEGVYRWEFTRENANNLSIAALDLSNSEYAVITGLSFNSVTGSNAALGGSGSGTNTNIQIGTAYAKTGVLSLAHFNNDLFSANGAVTVLTPYIVSGRLSATGRVLRKNGSVIASDSVATKLVSSANATIGGSFSTSYFDGIIYSMCIIKGTVSDAQLLTIERRLNALSGNAAGVF